MIQMPSSHSSESCSGSDSSSVIYDHEPFDTFRLRVLKLAQGFWVDSSPTDITIERMAGGGYNRIIGFSRAVDGQEKDQYILRVPRFEAAHVDREVAVLQFLRRYSTLPVPEIIRFEETNNNILESPYMVQNRIPGHDLYSSFPKLDHEGKCRVAKELGHVFHEMLSLHSRDAGVLVLSPDNKSLQAPLWIAQFTKTDKPMCPYSDGPTAQTTSSMLASTFKDRKIAALERCSTDVLRSELLDKFITMTAELENDSWLGNNQNSLCHLDLAPRNILVHYAPNASVPTISGILDWDSAVFGPCFMSCAPPLWIWAWNEDEDEDERTANHDPPTPELRQLKQLFEEAAGADYVRFAYETPYRLARQLVHYAIHDIKTKEDVDEAKAMLQEWDDFRRLQPKA